MDDSHKANQSNLDTELTQLPAVTSVIPHRAPFLFLDHISFCEHRQIIGQYRFTKQQDIFKGHFPDRPIVPGVLILEGAAQTLAYWALLHHPHHWVLLTGTEQAKWSHPVYPEQLLTYQIKVIKVKLGLVIANVEVYVEDNLVLNAKIKGFLQKKSSVT